MTAAPAELLTELDDQLSAAVRQASTRAEHIRLTRMLTTVEALKDALPSALSPVAASSPDTG